MRKYLIPAVSLAALTMGGMAFAQDTTTAPAPSAEQPTQAEPAKPDCAANPADPACASGTTAKTTPPADTNTGTTTTAPDTAGAPTTTPDTTTGTAQTTTTPDTTTGTAQTAPDANTTDMNKTADTATTADTSGPGFLASSFMGKTVYSSAKENIGDINDLLVGTNGQVKAAVIGVGGFLGMGEKDVAVPLDKLSMTKDENGMDYLTIQTSRAELEAAPAFDRNVVTGQLQ